MNKHDFALIYTAPCWDIPREVIDAIDAKLYKIAQVSNAKAEDQLYAAAITDMLHYEDTDTDGYMMFLDIQEDSWVADMNSDFKHSLQDYIDTHLGTMPIWQTFTSLSIELDTMNNDGYDEQEKNNVDLFIRIVDDYIECYGNNDPYREFAHLLENSASDAVLTVLMLKYTELFRRAA
jgi:hypothetical protein